MRVCSAMANYYLSWKFHKVNHSVYTKITQIACMLVHLLRFSLLGPRGLPRSSPLCSPSLCRRNPEDRISNHLPTFPLWSVRTHNFLLINTIKFSGSFQLIEFMHCKWPCSSMYPFRRCMQSWCIFGRAPCLTRKVERSFWETTLPPFILIYSAHYDFEWYFQSGRISCDCPLLQSMHSSWLFSILSWALAHPAQLSKV